MRFSRGLCGLALVLPLAACGPDEPLSGTGAEPSAVDEAETARDLAVALGCDGPTEIDGLDSPIRGDAADEGVKCLADGETLHIFLRTPPRQNGMGGTLENIDRLLVNVGDPGVEGCGVLVTDGWFFTSNSREELERVRDEVGGSVRPISPLGTPFSYMVEGCVPGQ